MDASIATSASLNCTTARPPKSPTTGANPPPRPTGANHLPTASICPATESGKTPNTSPTTKPPPGDAEAVGDKLRNPDTLRDTPKARRCAVIDWRPYES